ncbi:DUF4232 domain-containing protein [Streptomyces sp. ME19-01-6]|uniref:DUF4232 domain-containing protein n=1 Tax=Streptomyces sp. ME19-01-6 TaxID=3028686 RepID=UPI0029B8C732|nr:DUF4232 domain-containing protein [Streptomyces sp. ME19-01-6]MDX3231763.1 DUF4232 domain-containing protein [Streptomyces sp. ME19-01-6]
MRSNTTARIARRRSFRVAAAVLTAAAALTLTACNGDEKAAGQADTAPAGSSSPSGSSGGAQDSDAKDTEGGGSAHAGVERCHTQDLEAAFATGEDALPVPEESAGGATTATIVLMNKGTSSCRIGGFPGVDLTSINGGERWSLARSSQKWSPIEVEAGQSTEFTLNLAFTKEEEGFYQPAWVEITPPNETKSLKIEWPWETDSLVDQRSATRPATFVNPIG